MFGARTSYTLNRKSVVHKVVNRTIDFLESIEDDSSLAEKIEKVAAKLISSDPDVQFILGRLSQKFDFPGTLVIIPAVNDKTLLIEEFVLATGSEEVLSSPDAESLINTLTEIVLTNDKDKVNGFITMLKEAYDRSRKA